MRLPGFQFWHDEDGLPHVRFSPWLVWATVALIVLSVVSVLIRGLT